ncbi:MAG: biotin/lipoyl-binding protein [Eubacterium sp.]|nr:biotin/lipoyl-binding protein [Eubacterium sp.]
MEAVTLRDNRKKRIMAGFFIFLGVMWLCTVISKSIYASKLPIVSTESIQQKYVEHIVKTDGIVIAGEKSPVTVLGGLRVDGLAVQVGDRVEEGDVLFTIDLADLAEMMSEKQMAIAKLQTQIDTILENEELARQKRELEEQRAREDYDALARREDTLVGRGAEEVNQAEKDLADNGDDEALKDALQQAAYAEADAKWQRETAMKEAARKVEDITAPENADSTLEVSRLELSDLWEELSRFQKIKDAEGRITAPMNGIITDISIITGGRTSDSAVMLLANDSVPCQFKTVLTQEQKKYVGLNDDVTLKLDGSSREKEATVDYLSESSAMPGSYEVYIDLPERTGVPGLSGTMSRAESGEKHSCCVTPTAVYKEGARSYVYVVKERDGILGKEYYAEQVNVRVLDENESWVALEGGLDNDSVIITSSTKKVENGDVVRLSED